MPQANYSAYMKTDLGKAARARAQVNYLAKRKLEKPIIVAWESAALAQVLNNWRPV